MVFDKGAEAIQQRKESFQNVLEKSDNDNKKRKRDKKEKKKKITSI